MSAAAVFYTGGPGCIATGKGPMRECPCDVCRRFLMVDGLAVAATGALALLWSRVSNRKGR